MKPPVRWIAVGIFVLSSTVNYLDRQIFAALEPLIRAEFHLSYEGYGYLISAFSLIYSVGATVLGLTIDRIGLNAGASLAVGLWSAATMGTAWVSGLGSLVACRALLGFAQGGGIPATGKAFATYLEPKERALGTASNQLGITLGMVIAPLWAAYAAQHFGWRQAFLFPGLLGFAWIPLWLWIAKRTPIQPAAAGPKAPAVHELLRKRTYWGLLVATSLGMTLYSLWSYWTTSFLTKVWHLPETVVNQQLAWIPPLAAAAGALLGGTASFKLAQGGLEIPAARRQAALMGALLLLVATASVPFAPSPLVATFAIGMSFFGSTFLSVNLYALPLDLFGAPRAGFAIASLTVAYGLVQAVISPLIGRIVDLHGFTPVCLGASLLPLAGVAILYGTKE